MKTATGKRKRRPSLRARRILVPLDFSGKSRQALEYAIPLAELSGGKISLLHVLPPAYVPGEASFAYLPVDTPGLEAEVKKRLRTVADELIPEGMLDKLFVRTGTPYHEIVAAARRHKADMIVISTHGNSGITRVLLGSTAERVVRHASCPVLTVRRH